MAKQIFKFPGDRNKENVRLTQLLFTEFRQQLTAEYPPDPVRGKVLLLAEALSTGEWVVATMKNPLEANELAKWVAAVYACTFEVKPLVTSYTKMVDEARRNSDFIDTCTRAPFMILLYPEMVKQADWMLGKLLDILVEKKDLLIFTEDRGLLEDTVGSAITTMLSSKSMYCSV